MPTTPALNKEGIARKVAKTCDIGQGHAEKVVEILFNDILAEAIADGERVTIVGFGTFVAKTRPAREAKNPNTGEPVFVAETRVAHFGAAKALRDRLNPEE